MNLLHALMFTIVVAMATGQSIKIRVNHEAIDLLADSTVSEMEKGFKGMTFSNIIGNSSFYVIHQTFNISNLVLNGLEFPNPIFTFQSPNEVVVQTSSTNGKITGGYNISYTNTNTKTTLAEFIGTFSADLDDGNNVVVIGMNNEDGAFRTTASSCQSELSSLSIDGKNSQDGTDIVENILNYYFKAEIKKQMCPTLTDGLVPKVNSFIGDLETTPIDILGVSIDLNLVGDPVVTEMNNTSDSFVEAVLNGKCYPVSDPNITYNFDRENLPEFSSSDASVRLMLGSYVLKTLLCGLYETGIFTQQIDLDDPLVTNASPLQLNTVFLQSIAPEISNLGFTGAKPVRIMLQAKQCPNITMNPTNIIVDGQFVVSVFVINDSRVDVTGADRNATFAFSLNANASLSGQISILNDTIFPKLTSLTYSLSVLNAEPVGDNINLSVLQLILLIAKKQILEAVNGLFAGGIQIPAAFGFGLTNLGLELYDGYAEMSADVALV